VLAGWEKISEPDRAMKASTQKAETPGAEMEPHPRKVFVQSREELRAWLEENHSQKESIWLVTYRKCVPDKYVSVSEVLDEILCFGWMDGRRKKFSDRQTMQLLSPRRVKHWSKTYKDRVARLTREGRMHRAGLDAVELAKRNGGWDFLKEVDALKLPPDFEVALQKVPVALENYLSFPPSAQRDILRWIKLAAKPETRAQRIRTSVEWASHNRRASGTR
jgi:uncharacterized protein YdeI (YjbR/CyaY-like superfamily)